MSTAFPRRSLLAAGLSLGLLAAGTAQADSWCASKPVKFAGVNWESGMLLTELMGFVLQHGYDCKVDSIPGNSITLEQALGNNDIQVFAEEWIGRSEAWNKAAAAGKVVGVGAPIEGATEGWYVPRYLVEGEGAKAPKLKSIADLGQYAELFRDPEEPGKGRFYNCPAGWTCELENTQMLQSYGLSDKYTNFRPGTGPALDAAIVSATKRKQPILTYYWSPTPLLGRVDMVQLNPPRWRSQAHPGAGRPLQALPRRRPRTGGRAESGQCAHRAAQPHPGRAGRRQAGRPRRRQGAAQGPSRTLAGLGDRRRGAQQDPGGALGCFPKA